jgi:hypothetical protein
VLIYVGEHPDDYIDVMESDILELLKALTQKRLDLEFFIKSGDAEWRTDNRKNSWTSEYSWHEIAVLYRDLTVSSALLNTCQEVPAIWNALYG